MSDEENIYNSDEESDDEDVVRYEKGVMIVELRRGDLKLSDDELECVRRKPNFQVNGDLKESDFETELGVMGSKFRWEKLHEEEERLSPEEEEETGKAENRSTYNPITKTFNLACKRCTDMKENKKVFLAKTM